MDLNGLRGKALEAVKTRHLAPRLGRGAHFQHDRHAPRLVHLAPARVGRADHRLLLRKMRRGAHRSQISRPASCACSPSTRPTSGTRAAPPNCWAPRRACARCGGRDFRKENDILDVWFDSGSSHLAVLTKDNGLPWPSDMYLEGGDQYRGWFHSSLLVGVGLRGESPYRECATNGWQLDGEGRAMSKSLGNVIEPETDHQAVRRRRAAAVGRLGRLPRGRALLRADYHAHHRGLSQAAQHVPLRAGQPRTTSIPATDALPAAELEEIDRWMLYRAARWPSSAAPGTRSWRSTVSTRRCTALRRRTSAPVYFDVLKDRLYTAARTSRRGAARRRRCTASTTRWCG